MSDPSTPNKQAASDLDLEKGELEVTREDDLPTKVQGHYMRNLRHQIFTLYRRLFSIVFVINMAIFIALISTGRHSTMHVGLAVISNLFCAILMRQEYVINAFFNVFCAVPSSYVASTMLCGHPT